MAELAEQLKFFEKYKMHLNEGRVLPPAARESIDYILFENKYTLAQDDRAGKVFVNCQWIAYRIFFRDLNLLSYSPGCSYLETTTGLPLFLERYDTMVKSRARIKRHQPLSYIAGGALIGALGESLFFFEAAKNGQLSPWLIAPPIIAVVIGRVVGNRYRQTVARECGREINRFYRELKGLKTGWSALEGALR